VCSQVDTTSVATVAVVATAATRIVVQNWDDAWSRAAGAGRRGKHRRLDPGRHVRAGSNRTSWGEPGGRTVRLSEVNKLRTIWYARSCQHGTDPTRGTWLTVPEVAHVLGPATSPPETDVGLTWLETRERASVLVGIGPAQVEATPTDGSQLEMRRNR